MSISVGICLLLIVCSFMSLAGCVYVIDERLKELEEG